MEGPTAAREGPERVCLDMVDLCRRALAAAGVEAREVAAAGVGLPGPVDTRRGTTLQTPNIPGLEGFPVASFLREQLGVPVFVENDANLAALGEWALGAGRGARHVLYVTVSTGIGGGIVLDGRVYSGAHGSAGEVGHILAVPGGRPCGCGRRGCLEAHASGTAIGQIATEALAAGEPSRLREMADPVTGRVTAAQVAAAAREGDPLATRIWDQAMRHIGWALGDLANILDPERIVLGGGVARAGEQMLGPVRAAAAERVLPSQAGRLDIRLWALGGDAGALGAAVHAALATGQAEGIGGR
nr:MAG: hypothetical protein DIU70_11360 [Bacillota bacterium]